ncbi:methylenetetrahydrofolate reduct [Rhizoclosmatium globosum]|uniref:Methylenetetrahydrofolate reduct n=1 Tax=Rhizoclosmatium globosum TaxID=329046 RepID=A0A1Y2CRA1_9FUNG|nr:methylenetetrahydrofolate reduct [Rhizoclosmatium globosum]|eukprot:ORY49493.1 methylenetetrahydrofolate reduct [Rhizoclosmatium globosum]
MKITEKIEKALAEDRCFWSFEYFPPRTETGAINLFDRMERMYSLGPEFIDVTWGAGGSTSEATLQCVTTAQVAIGLETSMHLTCTNMPKSKIDDALKQCKEVGIMNILALRGDPAHGQATWTATEGGFANAIDLVKYIREQYGDYFCIGVAGYPEGHIENPNKEADFNHFIEKAKLADYCVTQLFYEPELYIKWVEKVRAAGCTIPILPGIMPIQAYAGFQRLIGREKTYVPPEVLAALEPIKDDDKAVKEYGVKLAIEMCNKLRAAGQKGFHFYTMNLEKSVRLIVEGLGFVAPLENVKPLPWNPSLSKKRKLESVRPIFWRNRTRSYIARTEAWDDFPNGRWGDSRSPAFGELDGHSTHLKATGEEAIKTWGTPKTLPEICNLFAEFCKGNLSSLPWCDTMAPESLQSKRNSPVDGVDSSDIRYGWGPKNGFVYQKSYVEFFVSPEALDTLIKKLSKNPYITYYAVNKQGQEIVQPTIVDGDSFMAWKDEAYELWAQWGRVYEKGSESATLIEGITESWFLMNVVNNNYRDGSAIFEIFD